MPSTRIAALLWLALGLSQRAAADIYAYDDSRGVTHFSNVPTDSRFVLLLSTPSEAAGTIVSKPPVDWLAHSSKFDPAILTAARANTLPAALVRAVIVVESGFNPRAVSKKGAVGLMQLLPATARRYGVKDIYDPDQNIDAGTRYLRDLMVRFNHNLELVLAAYNAGEDAVERYGRHIPPFAETQNYVPSVMRVYQKLLHQTRG